MNFPVWELATGGGVMIALVSVIHVFVSHFAVGGGLWLAWTERKARKENDTELLEFVKSHSKFFLLVTLVFGAITGVGIWFIVSLVSPSTIFALIRAYVWGWAMEWVFFAVEIAAALAYWYGWGKLSAKVHMTVGWIYFICAYMSLVIINGIITFMLTSGGWLENHEFWTGFFNPTYWPSVVLRTFVAIAMAGLFSLFWSSLLPKGNLKTKLVKYCSKWIFVGTALTWISAFWYKKAILSFIPEWTDFIKGEIPVLNNVLAVLTFGIIATLVASIFAFKAKDKWHWTGSIILMAFGLTAFFGGEWVREAGRKPYTIYGYMYSTGALVSDAEKLERDGMIAHSKWINPNALKEDAPPEFLGAELYRAWCQPCHTMDGYNGMRPYLAHWDPEFIEQLSPKLHHMRARMPQWYGTDFENDALTAYLVSEGAKKESKFPSDKLAAQQFAWDLSCGMCHTVDNFRPLRESLADMSREELNDDILDMLADYDYAMPDYLGSEEERQLLLDFILELYTDGGEK